MQLVGQSHLSAQHSPSVSGLCTQGRTGGEGIVGVSVAFLQQVVLPLGLAFLIMRAIVANGRRLVNRPQLCPRLAHPWSDDAAVDPGGAKKH